MNRRPQLSYALALALTAGATTWAALTSWRGFLIGAADYLGPLVVAAVLIAVSGAVLRWLGSPRTVTVAAQVVVATVFVSGNLGGGPIPVGDTGDRLERSLDLAVEAARAYSAPIGPEAPPVAPLLIVGGVVFILLVDILACTMRRVPIAGLALLAIYSVPAGLVESGPGWLAFVLAAAGFLALLHLDSREHLLRWGRPLGMDEHNPWTTTNPLTDAVRVGAGRIGATATALALVLPPLVPVLDIDLLGIGPGDGDDEITIRKPRADLRGDLERDRDIPMLRVTTDDPDPRYLRIAALNRFTGEEWSSGDRGVADDATATGELPEPEGVDSEVPRTTFDYQVDITDEFDSTWLPTQFPASSVTADGDWRFDADTMDFLAVPDDLDTRGLSYEMTALELEYGTSGNFFDDASSGAVDEEFLEVPPDLPPIVTTLALQVTAGTLTDYQAARRLQEWFRETGGFRYSIDNAPDGTGAEAFETFLTEGPGGRVGYCEQFASAMGVMARIVGIPARVAVGFLEPEQVGASTYEYSSHDLHAWTELYFEGAGWVMFEPTPPRIAGTVPDYTTVPVPVDAVPTADPTNDDPTRGNTAGPEDPPSATVTEPEAGADEAGGGADEGTDWTTVLLRVGVAVLVLLALVALALTPRTLRERVRRRRLAGGPEEVWAELRASAVDLTVPWPSGRSPHEIGQVLVDHLGDRSDAAPPERPRTGPDADPEATRALEHLVAAVERSRYARPGSVLPDPGIAEDARVCAAALAAGAPQRSRTRATWLPRSLWLRTPRVVEAPTPRTEDELVSS